MNGLLFHIMGASLQGGTTTGDTGGANPNVQYIAEASTITTPALLTSQVFTTQHTILWRGFLDDNFINSTQSGVNAPATYATAFTIPFFGVEVPVSSLSGTLSFGVRQANGDEWGLSYDGALVTLYKKVSGSTTTLASAAAAYSGAYSLGFSVTDKSLHAWVNTDSEWATVVGHLTDGDFRDPATLAAHSTVFIAGSGFQTGTMKYGYMKGVGIANQSPITFDDGTPLKRDGYHYFLCSIPHACASTVSQTNVTHSHAAIMKVNLTTGEVICHARLAMNRGGLLYGENSGCVTYDETADKFYFIIPNWGRLTTAWEKIDSYLYELTDFPSGVQVLSGGRVLNLPTSANANYDPDLKKIGGTWYLSYTTTNQPNSWTAFYPVVATSPDLINWTAAGSDSAQTAVEGNKLIQNGGEWKNLASNFGNMRVYDLSMSYLWKFDVPGGFVNAPASTHPAIVTVRNGGNTEHWWLMFNNTRFDSKEFSWGEMAIAKGTNVQTGHDYPDKEYTLL